MSDTTNETPPRRLSFCDVCGGLDDHPRHRIAGVVNPPSDELMATLSQQAVPAHVSLADLAGAAAILNDANTTCRHIDCCAAQGCVLCQASEQITGGIRGEALTHALAVERATLELDGEALGFDPVGLVEGRYADG